MTMEQTFSKDFKRIFLLSFTKELIIHSAKKDIIKLQKIIESRERKRKEKAVGESKAFAKEIEEPKTPFLLTGLRGPQTPGLQPRRPISASGQLPRPMQPLFRLPLIPSEQTTALPPHLEYLRPIPTAGVDIDLYKINPLIKDVAVRLIQANPEERVIVSGTMGTKPTNIILSQEDIDTIIDKFSEFSKIPAEEGIYRVVVGNLILTAIISGVTSSRFIIKKMMTPSASNPFGNQQKYPPLPSSLSGNSLS